MIERLNSTIILIMKISTQNGNTNDWGLHLKKIERDLNSTISQTLGVSPFEAPLGYHPRFQEGELQKITTVSETYTKPFILQEKLKDNILTEQAMYKSYYDARRNQTVKYKLGDIVFVKGNPVATGYSTKLQSTYKGPLVFIGIEHSDTYGLKKLNESGDRNYQTTAHVSQLKLWKNSNCEHESEEENESDGESDVG